MITIKIPLKCTLKCWEKLPETWKYNEEIYFSSLFLTFLHANENRIWRKAHFFTYAKAKTVRDTFGWNSWSFGPTRGLTAPRWSKGSFVFAKINHSQFFGVRKEKKNISGKTKTVHARGKSNQQMRYHFLSTGQTRKKKTFTKTNSITSWFACLY